MPLSRMERRASIERAQAALAAADRFLEIAAEQQRKDAEIKPRVSRKALREQGLLGAPKLVGVEVEITGVLARGTSATDYLSWDTTTLPVIARPKNNPFTK